jgi:hypothetical protein
MSGKDGQVALAKAQRQAKKKANKNGITLFCLPVEGAVFFAESGVSIYAV